MLVGMRLLIVLGECVAWEAASMTVLRESGEEVTIPLSLPGIRAGSLLVFISCLGAYLTPDLLGGGKTIMIGNLIQNQFTTARDWPFGSALSLVLMAALMAMLVPALKRGEETML